MEFETCKLPSAKKFETKEKSRSTKLEVKSKRNEVEFETDFLQKRDSSFIVVSVTET